MSLPLLEGTLIHTLGQLALAKAPNEAVGLIVRGDQVVELTNGSDHPEDSFSVGVDDITLQLDRLGLILTQDEWHEVILWHSHPGGGIGPSRVDMRNRVPAWAHLVITLTPDEVIPTWY